MSRELIQGDFRALLALFVAINLDFAGVDDPRNVYAEEPKSASSRWSAALRLGLDEEPLLFAARQPVRTSHL